MTENLKNTDTLETFANIFSGKDNFDIKTDEADIKTVEEKIAEEDTTDVKQEALSKKTTDKQEDTTVDLKTEYELLKKQLNDAKAWGHKKNSAYINAKKKVTDFLTKLQEDSIIDESEAQLALSSFNISDDVAEQSFEKKENPYVQLKQNLDKEFGVFKKYNKEDNAEEKYQAFFSFLPLFSSEEQEKIVNYMMNEEPNVVIDNIMILGGDVYDNLHKGAEKAGGIIPFVKSLHLQIEKLEKRNKELEAELDTTEGVVHNRSINSKVQETSNTNNKESLSDIWRKG